jgi:acylphosphatase
MDSKSLTTWQILVSGKVQGVGYRRFAQKAAQSLGIRGWARNLKDLRVEIHAQGSETQLNEFLVQLKKGPPFGRVDQAEARTISAEKFTGFEIAQDGELS